MIFEKKDYYLENMWRQQLRHIYLFEYCQRSDEWKCFEFSKCSIEDMPPSKMVGK